MGARAPTESLSEDSVPSENYWEELASRDRETSGVRGPERCLGKLGKPDLNNSVCFMPASTVTQVYELWQA